MKLFFDSLDSQNELTSDIISSIIELIINDKKFPQYFFVSASKWITQQLRAKKTQ